MYLAVKNFYNNIIAWKKSEREREREREREKEGGRSSL